MNAKKPFQVPGYISKVSTMSNYLRIQIDTQETLTDEQIARLFQLTNKLGWLSFNVHQIENENLLELPKIEVKEKKSKSQQMRAIIYQIWDRSESDKDFNDYYNWYMDLMIEKLRDKLT